MRSTTAALLVLLTAALYAAFAPAGTGKLVSTHEWANERVLLVTAHPDDECMFFAPTLLALNRAGAIVHSLCLSIGDADGIGNIRKDELGRSLDVLGVPASRRNVLDHPGLQDNITLNWDPYLVSDVVHAYVAEHAITTILTFDAHGISGHPNHRALFHGAALLLSRPDTQLKLFTLVSVPLVAKYTGPLAPLVRRVLLPLDHLRRQSRRTPLVALSGGRGYRTAHRAMREHASQLVWFRHLYVLASRYMWVNDWVAYVPAG